MGAKHTPGPWHPGHHTSPEIDCECRSILSEWHAGAIAVIPKNNGKSISDGGNDAAPEDEAIANAHLIAAAPDMPVDRID